MKARYDYDSYDDNESVSSAVLSASMSTRCGAASGWGGGDGHQILRVAGNILHTQTGLSDKGCPPVWWLAVLLTSQQHKSLRRYGIFHSLGQRLIVWNDERNGHWNENVKWKIRSVRGSGPRKI